MKIKPTTPESFDGEKLKNMTIDEVFRWPRYFQTEHAMIGGKKLSAYRYHYLTCPKRLPRKLKKKMQKLEAQIQEVIDKHPLPKIFI